MSSVSAIWPPAMLRSRTHGREAAAGAVDGGREPGGAGADDGDVERGRRVRTAWGVIGIPAQQPPRRTSSSAICTAFSAAPLRRLSRHAPEVEAVLDRVVLADAADVHGVACRSPCSGMG